MTASTPRRLVWLLRVSSQHQADTNTIASQRAALEQELLTRPGEVVAVIEEEAVSGRTPVEDRPALRQLEALSASQGYDELWMSNADRASRHSDPRSYNHVFGCALDAGAVILEVKSHFLCNPASREGRMWWFMSAEGAAAAWESIREATLNGRRTALQAGRAGNSAHPWGIRYSRAEGWSLDSKVAPTIKRIFELAITPTEGHPAGLSIGGIKATLEADGIAPPKGGAWHEGTIYRILRHPAYKGELPQKMPDTDRVVVLSIPPMIDAATWQAAQIALDRRSNCPIRKKYTIAALLRGLVYCGVCGSKMYLRAYQGKYYCRPCHSPGHPMALVDQAVWEAVSSRLENSELLTEAVSLHHDGGTSAQEIMDAEVSLATIARKKAGLTARWNQDLLTDEEYDRELSGYAERSRVLLQRMNAARQASVLAETARQQRATLGARLETLRSSIPTADFATRRAILEVLFPPDVGRIMLHPNRKIELHGMLVCEATTTDDGSPGGQGSSGSTEVVKPLPRTRSRKPFPRPRCAAWNADFRQRAGPASV
ncbi:MAG: recombinase family protein [Pseudomonadota bacterium]